MAKFRDASGQLQDVSLGNGAEIYKEAVSKRVSVRQLINSKYDTEAGAPEAFKQMCYHAGMRFEKDPVTGQPASTVEELLNPEAAGPFTNQPAEPTSRILFPAATLAIMEDKLAGRHGEVTSLLDSIVGFQQTISTTKFEQPVLSFSGTGGPEDFQYQAISQNTAPALMLSITASDVTRKVGTMAIGLEISQEAMAATPMDFVSMSLGRFATIGSYNTWITNLGLLLSGDPDAAVTSYSAGTSALTSFKASSLDSTIVADGVLTHAAWIKYLLKNPLYMQPTHVVCDVNAALAIENRTGRPTNVQNNSTDRLDSPMELVWPSLGQSVKVIALPVGSITANTIMGFQANAPAIGKVTSLFADYSGVEDVILKRSRVMRFDKGELYWRVFDSAFSVMTLVA